jgi:hypothetical protein
VKVDEQGKADLTVTITVDIGPFGGKVEGTKTVTLGR